MIATSAGAKLGTEAQIKHHNIRPRWVRPDWMFLLLLALLVACAFWSYIGHERFVSRELQYIPRDNTVLIATGPIATIWTSFDKHFGPVIRARETGSASARESKTGNGSEGITRTESESGSNSSSTRENVSENESGGGTAKKEKEGLAGLIEEVQTYLNKKGIDVEQLADLAQHGIDTSRGLYLGAFGTTFVAVVPVLSEATFTKTLQRYFSAETTEWETIPGSAELRAR